jgi:hypothetical protein
MSRLSVVHCCVALILLGPRVARASDVFVADVPSLLNAIVNAPGSGQAHDHRIHVLPGDYAFAGITVQGRRFTLRAVVPGSVTLRRTDGNHLLDVAGSSDVRLEDLELDGDGFRVIKTNGVADLHLHRVTLRDGLPGGNNDGGLIWHRSSGQLSLFGAFLENARAGRGGLVFGNEGTLSIEQSTLVDGEATVGGGALYARDLDLEVTDVVFRNNTTGGDGGAVNLEDLTDTAVFTRSWFEANEAADWAGSLWTTSSVDLDSSMVCLGRSVSHDNGGVRFVAPATQAADLEIEDSVFLNNGDGNSVWGGAGLRVDGGGDNTRVRVDRSTFVGNHAAGSHAIRLDVGSPSTQADLRIQHTHFAHHPSGSTVSNHAASAEIRDSNLFPSLVNPIVNYQTSGNTALDPGYPAPSATSCALDDILPSLSTVTPSVLGAFDEGFVDADGDGHYAPLDCDDDPLTGAGIHPGAPDLCDGIDNDCDRAVDEDAMPGTFFLDRDEDGLGDLPLVGACRTGPFVVAQAGDCDDDDDDIGGATPAWPDGDGDGFGDGLADALTACELPVGFVPNDVDCDDANDSINPDADDVCGNGIDEDCTGVADDGDDLTTWFVDADQDGFGAGPPIAACTQPADTSDVGDDCDDTDPSVSPGAVEVCDGLDQNCDGQADEDLDLDTPWYADADEDGWGAGLPAFTCGPAPTGGTWVLATDDCDDTWPLTHPGAPELCDSVDNDCDGAIDNDTTPLSWYADADGDGFGDPDASPVLSCAEVDGHVLDATDCDDTDEQVHPEASDATCDGVDSDCDGRVDDEAPATPSAVDADQDGFPVAGPLERCAEPLPDRLDCDDTRSDRYPDAPERCDGIDTDCDGLADPPTCAVTTPTEPVETMGLACSQGSSAPSWPSIVQRRR